MRIEIKDDNQNWLNWGKLVQIWIDDDATRPNLVGALKAQLAEHGVVATVAGDDRRIVQIQSYNDPGEPLKIMLPTREMRDAKLATVGPGPYKLPLFYDIAFGGATRVNLSAQEAHDFALRRIGEYSVNECC